MSKLVDLGKARPWGKVLGFEIQLVRAAKERIGSIRGKEGRRGGVVFFEKEDMPEQPRLAVTSGGFHGGGEMLLTGRPATWRGASRTVGDRKSQ